MLQRGLNNTPPLSWRFKAQNWFTSFSKQVGLRMVVFYGCRFSSWGTNWQELVLQRWSGEHHLPQSHRWIRHMQSIRNQTNPKISTIIREIQRRVSYFYHMIYFIEIQFPTFIIWYTLYIYNMCFSSASLDEKWWNPDSPASARRTALRRLAWTMLRKLGPSLQGFTCVARAHCEMIETDV